MWHGFEGTFQKDQQVSTFPAKANCCGRLKKGGESRLFNSVPSVPVCSNSVPSVQILTGADTSVASTGRSLSVGHPFALLSNFPEEVKNACICVAECDTHDIINNRCSKLGEWLCLSKSLQLEEAALKSAMPEERGRFLESKNLCLMKHII